MKRKVIGVAALAFAVALAGFWMFNQRRSAPSIPLPQPNGHDDYVAATQWLVKWNGDLPKLPIDALRKVVDQNSKALEAVRGGLQKQSAVPVRNDANWFNTHMIQASGNKLIAQLLVAEGLVYLHEGRTNEAASSFAHCIQFAHAANYRGLMLDDLVGIACQAIGAQRLIDVVPSLSPEVAEQLLATLIVLDQTREKPDTVLQRDAEWSRATYGFWRQLWGRIALRKTVQASRESFEKKHARSVAALRLIMTELAIRSYAKKNGKPPPTLAELVPQWLPAVPLDPFSKDPLIYRTTTNSFLLYSVGPDGKDDQGRPLPRGEVQNGDLRPDAL